MQPSSRTFVYTIGHSTRPIEQTIAILQNYVIQSLADVRKIPHSRRNPQYSQDAFAASVHEAGIVYSHWPELGGLRKASSESLNHGLRNPAFRAYADYMLTGEFDRAIERMLKQARLQTTAVMCAEAFYKKCHRMLLSDALVVRGVDVIHLIDINRVEIHKLTSFARVTGTRITYGNPIQPGLFD